MESILAKKENKAENVVVEEKPKETTVEFLASLAAVLVTGLFIITFVMQAFEIPSSSMENTLLIGDHVFVNRIQFAPKSSWAGPLLPYRDVRHGDIVVFLSPAEPGLYVVKRIIGTAGDHIHLRNGVVYRNGEELKEPYVIHPQDSIPNPYRDNFPAVPPSESYNVYPSWEQELPMHIQGDDLVVPPDHYFAMGDNRDNSWDCRYWGFVDRNAIMGRPFLIFWSVNATSADYGQSTFTQRLRSVFDTLVHLPARTRWSRMLHTVH